jgi:hypothetical protein
VANDISKKLTRFAFDGYSAAAFWEYERWFREHEPAIVAGRKEQCEQNSFLLSMIIAALDNDVKRTTVESLFARRLEDGGVEVADERNWLEIRLACVAQCVVDCDVAMPWETFRSLLKLEANLWYRRRGVDCFSTFENGDKDKPSTQHVCGRFGNEPATLSDEQCAQIDSMLAIVEHLQHVLVRQHGAASGQLLRSDDKIWLHSMALNHAKGHGLEAVVRCYQSMLAECSIEAASMRCNDVLLRLTVAAMYELMGPWNTKEGSEALRARMPDTLVAQLFKVLSIVASMRGINKATFMSALLIARTLNNPEAAALVLDALAHNQAIGCRVADLMLLTCLRFRPRNAESAIDTIWRLYASPSSNLKPSTVAVGLTMSFFHGAGYVDSAIGIYERAIDEFDVPIDVRNVAALARIALMHRYVVPTEAQREKVLALVHKSGFFDHKYVQCHVRKLPKSFARKTPKQLQQEQRARP